MTQWIILRCNYLLSTENILAKNPYFSPPHISATLFLPHFLQVLASTPPPVQIWGKKCFSRNVCLSALGNCLPCFWIWGRNMLPQICEFAFPVFEFGEEICFPRNMSLPSLFFKFGEDICFPRNVCLSAPFWNLGKKYGHVHECYQNWTLLVLCGKWGKLFSSFSIILSLVMKNSSMKWGFWDISCFFIWPIQRRMVTK